MKIPLNPFDKEFGNMDKRAQFYIFAAIILCSVVFVGTVNKITVEEPSKKFQSFYENYLIESSEVINSAIYESRDISEQFKNFTLDFIEYADSKNVELGILYVLIYPDNEAIIVNYLNSEANVDFVYSVPPDTEKIINLGNNFTLEIDDQEYYFNVSSGENIKLEFLFRDQ
ncbi:hypothetical protein JXB41_03135 [Candidatus Woesearchaeota archaeon]|nr:hypothetical protein [Candidatus Woesearchaeota archaeon]